MMSKIANAEVVREFCEAYSRGDAKGAVALAAEDCVAVYPTLVRYTKDEWERLLTEERRAFPDASIQIWTSVAQGDKVAIEFGWRATQKGEVRGATPTNRTFDLPCMLLFILEDGKIKLVKYYWNTRLWDLHETVGGVAAQATTAEAR